MDQRQYTTRRLGIVDALVEQLKDIDGLKKGDNWCVCADWYARAVKAGYPCKVYIRSTNIKTLKHIDLATLKKNAIDLA